MTDLFHYLARDTLKDGTKVTVRAIRASDAPAILEAFSQLDRESVYRRFFSPKKELSDAELRQLTEVDFHQVTALVVTTERDGLETLIGGGRFAALASEQPQSAELAFLTAADYRGRGVAGLILRHLTSLAREAGITQFEADVLAENRTMLDVLQHSGLTIRQKRDGNVVHLTLTLQH
ncbi:MAG: GNAT family N-acetyltransferase [Methyloceanibacter sp.]